MLIKLLYVFSLISSVRPQCQVCIQAYTDYSICYHIDLNAQRQPKLISCTWEYSILFSRNQKKGIIECLQKKRKQLTQNWCLAHCCNPEQKYYLQEELEKCQIKSDKPGIWLRVAATPLMLILSISLIIVLPVLCFAKGINKDQGEYQNLEITVQENY